MTKFKCPRCGKEATAPAAPVNCGDCLFNDVEVIEMIEMKPSGEFTNKAFTDMFSLAPRRVKPKPAPWKKKRVPTLTGRERDTQRQRVYKSDAATMRFDRADVSTVPAIERYVAKVWASKRMLDAYPQMVSGALPAVKNGQGRRRAGGNLFMITMPVWSRREGIVLHELAHTITQRVHGAKVAAHGWQYCDIYLSLVLYMMGREAHDALKLAFKGNKVRFTAPRKGRQLTEEERATLVARLENARRAKEAAGAA